MLNFKYEVFHEFDKKLTNIWINFEKNSSHYVFQKLEWQKLWFYQTQRHKKNLKCFLVVIYKDNKVIMILPLCVEKKFKLNILCWAGFPFSDYNAPLVKKNLVLDKNTFKYFIKKIFFEKKYQIDCIKFENQPNNINGSQNPFYDHLNNIKNNNYYGLDLIQKNLFDKKELSNVNYQIRKLKSKGKLDFKVVKQRNEIKEVLNFLIKHKSKQYEKTNAWNLMKKTIFRNFFILSSLRLKDINYLTYLKLDDKIIAAHSGFIYRNKCYYLFPTYDDSFKKFSPGKILLFEMINDCKKKSLNYFDLTIGNEFYKKKFSNNIQPASFYFKSIKIKSLFYILFLKLKNKIKKLN